MQLASRTRRTAKELRERLGRNDLCPCGSGRKFQEVLPEVGAFRRREPKLLPTIKQEGTPSGVPLFVLAEFLSLLSLRLLHPDALKSGAIAIPNCAKAAQFGSPGVGDPGPAAARSWSDISFTQGLSFSSPDHPSPAKPAGLGTPISSPRNAPGLTLFRAYGAAFSRVTQLRRSRSHFRETMG